MFDFHHKIEALEEQWGREKQDLAKVTFISKTDKCLLMIRWRRDWRSLEERGI